MAVGAKDAVSALEKGLRSKIKVSEEQSVKNQKPCEPAMGARVLFERMMNPEERIFVLVITRK